MPKPRNRATGELCRQIRRARLDGSVASPNSTHIQLLDPDAEGALMAVTREEAIVKGLPVYVSHRLTYLDRVFLCTDGRPVNVRYTSNGLSAGQLKFQKQHHVNKEAA